MPVEHEHTAESLTADLRALGVEAGEVLFVHSSFRSLGPVAGGAQTVVDALADAVGPDGTILMPSFNLVDKDDRAATWDPATSPSTVGWLTEFFRRMPGTVCSDHYSHSVAARGRRAEWFVCDHRSDEGLRSPWDVAPWGKTYGVNSPMIRAYDADGKVLMIGVDYTTSTYMHVVEVRHWHERLADDAEADYQYIDRLTAGGYWEGLGRMRRGRLGDADCRLFAIREFVDTVLADARRCPQRYCKWWTG